MVLSLAIRDNNSKILKYFYRFLTIVSLFSISNHSFESSRIKTSSQCNCLQFYRKYTFNASTIVNALPLTPVSEVRSGIHNHPLETEIFILTNEPSVCAIFRKKNIPILSLKLSKKTKFVKNCSKGYLLKKKKKPDRILYSRTTGTGNPTENRSCNYIIYILSRYEMKNLAY